MLTITHIAEDGKMLAFEIEGRITGQVDRTRQEEWDHYLKMRNALALDLPGIAFVDARGVKMLKALSRRCVRLIKGSVFRADC